MNDMASYYDGDSGWAFPDPNEDSADVYQAFLLNLPRHGLILNVGSGRDSSYFRRHGYHIVEFDPSVSLIRFAGVVIEQSLESARWDSEFDGVWACNSLHAIPWASIDSILSKLSQALKPEGVMLVSLVEWGADWETSPFVRGCDERNLMQVIRKHAPSLMLDAVWVSNRSVNALLLRR